MLLLVLTDNFLVLYAGWELVGVSSFLLIGFFFEKSSAPYAAKKAFLANRVGDFGFLLGILLIYTYTNTLSFDVAAAQIAAGKMTGGVLTLAAILTFFGAIGKSGQFPLHVWLPDAMEGANPSKCFDPRSNNGCGWCLYGSKINDYFCSSNFPSSLGF